MTAPQLTLKTAGDLVLSQFDGYYPYTAPTGTPTPTADLNNSSTDTLVAHQVAVRDQLYGAVYDYNGRWHHHCGDRVSACFGRRRHHDDHHVPVDNDDHRAATTTTAPSTTTTTTPPSGISVAEVATGAGSSGSNSASASLPTLTSGDYLIAVATNDNGASSVTAAPSVSGGTTTLLGSYFSGGAGTYSSVATYSVTGFSSKSTATSLSVTFNSDYTDIVVYEVAGGGSTPDIDAAFSSHTSTAADVTAPQLTLSTAGDLVLSQFDGYYPYTAPTGTPTPTADLNNSSTDTLVAHQVASGTSYTAPSTTTTAGGTTTAAIAVGACLIRASSSISPRTSVCCRRSTNQVSDVVRSRARGCRLLAA